MALGVGKYDDLCTYVRETAKAKGAAVIVIEGEKGMGFSVQMPLNHLERLPAVLRKMADDAEEVFQADVQAQLRAAIFGTHPWCESCQSYHVKPKTHEAHAQLQCKAPWVPTEEP